MRFLLGSLVLAASLPAGMAGAQQAPVVAAAAPAYSVENSDIGSLLDDPATKAVLDRHLPGFSANPQVDMARSMTLKSVQQYSPDQVTDEALAKIQADLAKLPAKK